MTSLLRLSPLMLVTFLCSLNLNAQDPYIAYVVDLTDVKNHYVGVSLQTQSTGDTTDLMIPVWTPGSYLVREYARHIESVTATDRRGNALPVKKTRKNHWQVTTKGVDRFNVSYRIYCNELSVRTNFVCREFAVLNGAPTFLTVPKYRQNQHVIRLMMPKGWKKSATSMTADERRTNQYIASSYDEVVDSPIVAGNLHFYPFQVGHVPHVLVNVGEKGQWDGAAAALDLKKVVKAHHDMWKSVPYKRYLFINVIGEAGGGLEHDNSCLMMTSRWTYRDRFRYMSWLSLASHEFFHTWNVRRLRPKALVKYDYDNENYTPSLWIAEGVTSYYEDLLLVRAKLMSSGEFLSRLSMNIAQTQGSPGRKVQSLSQSSYDSWIKFYRPDENSGNTSISYYSKGAVAAFILDARIRMASDNKKSLDDVMRKLFDRYSGDKGYSTKEFRDTVNEVAGKDLGDFFKNAIDSTEELDYSSALECFGLALQGFEVQQAEKNGRTTSYRKTPWVGASVNGENVVTRVERNSPATQAGLNTDDEVIAINGFRLNGNFSTKVRQAEIGDELELIVARRQQVFEMTIKVGGKTSVSWRLRRATRTRSKQKDRYRSWLGS